MRAFTLIDSLATVAIIGTVAAISLPALRGVRNSAKDAVCKAQLRQWHNCLESYKNDYNDNYPFVPFDPSLPSNARFARFIDDYIDIPYPEADENGNYPKIKPYLCPSHPLDKINSSRGLSYFYTFNLLNPGPETWRRLMWRTNVNGENVALMGELPATSQSYEHCNYITSHGQIR